MSCVESNIPLQTVQRRTGASINVYLILHNEDTVLLLLRKNTGYCDGYFSLIAGHVEDGESATSAMIREAHEEAGICLDRSSLRVVHVMHRCTNRFNIDVFFECHDWQGDIVNQEPDKCEGLFFVPVKQLPPNTIDYIRSVLEAVEERKFYSEYGWTRDSEHSLQHVIHQ
jgi:8-oxo-dGTP pyrophosphatase MutT (NUDIX family)